MPAHEWTVVAEFGATEVVAPGEVLRPVSAARVIKRAGALSGRLSARVDDQRLPIVLRAMRATSTSMPG